MVSLSGTDNYTEVDSLVKYHESSSSLDWELEDVKSITGGFSLLLTSANLQGEWLTCWG